MDQEQQNLMYTIVIAISISVLMLKCLFKNNKKQKSKGKTIFILGECNSGKTHLFYKLSQKQELQTVSSIDINQDNIQVDNKQYQLMDIPGHQHFKSQFFDQIEKTKQILILVDSTKIEQLQKTAELIYNIIISNFYIQNEFNILVLLNKQDLDNPMSQEQIMNELSKNIERIKTSQNVHQQYLGDQSLFDDYLKNERQLFEFKNNSKIQFLPISIKQKSQEELLAIITKSIEN